MPVTGSCVDSARTGISGSSLRYSTTTSATSATRPAANGTKKTGEVNPTRASEAVPKNGRNVAARASGNTARSSRRSGSCGSNGSYPTNPASRPSAPATATAANSSRQCPPWATGPPISGPAVVAPNSPTSTMATVQGSRSGPKRVTSGGSAAMSSRPVPVPCNTRPTPKTRIPGASAASTEPTTNTAS